MNFIKTIQNYMFWIDLNTLANVISCIFNVAHFIKLIFTEQRSKNQVNFDLIMKMHIDSVTEKTFFVNESTVVYEKIFSDYSTLVNALSVYLAIRALYNTDHLEFECVIELYIQQFAFWSKHHNWFAIIIYFVVHFRKHQFSINSWAWFEVNI